MAWLLSAFSSIRARCPKKVRRRDLTMDESVLDPLNKNIGNAPESYVLIQSTFLSSLNNREEHAGSKTVHQQNPPVLHWKCWLTEVDLYNGRKTVVVVA